MIFYIYPLIDETINFFFIAIIWNQVSIKIEIHSKIVKNEPTKHFFTQLSSEHFIKINMREIAK